MDLYAIFLILCMTTLGSSKTLNPLNVIDFGATLWSSKTLNPLNVIDFGAVGNGITDDSKAFMKAWQAACVATQEITLKIPANMTFLLKPVTFLGPCKSPRIYILVEGNIVAPSKISEWSTPYMDSWIVFASVNGLTVVGNGTIDGRGFDWWECAVKNQCERPTGMKFQTCKNIQISELKIINSPAWFLYVSNCDNIIISNLKIFNPETSPNTDGIDISHSTNVHVQNSHISTGDDCIAIKPGCSHINITDVFCEKGHGISIGSLGENGQYDTVEEVYVKHCSFGSSTNGARIKTWQGGTGFVRNVHFEDITFVNTSNPIYIDQFYCPHAKCANQTQAVQVSNISFDRFRGTSFTETAIYIACCETVHCSGIVLDHIHIRPSVAKNKVNAICINADGRSADTDPQVDLS